MQRAPSYADAALDIYDHLEARIAACEAGGIERSRIVADPGIGFGKTVRHNLGSPGPAQRCFMGSAFRFSSGSRARVSSPGCPRRGSRARLVRLPRRRSGRRSAGRSNHPRARRAGNPPGAAGPGGDRPASGGRCPGFLTRSPVPAPSGAFPTKNPPRHQRLDRRLSRLLRRSSSVRPVLGTGPIRLAAGRRAHDIGDFLILPPVAGQERGPPDATVVAARHHLRRSNP